jgi:hypothetical protein
MTRMHMWGPGTAFQDFEAFLDSMKKRWVVAVVGCRLSVVWYHTVSYCWCVHTGGVFISQHVRLLICQSRGVSFLEMLAMEMKVRWDET